MHKNKNKCIFQFQLKLIILMRILIRKNIISSSKEPYLCTHTFKSPSPTLPYQREHNIFFAYKYSDINMN